MKQPHRLFACSSVYRYDSISIRVFSILSTTIVIFTHIRTEFDNFRSLIQQQHNDERKESVRVRYLKALNPKFLRKGQNCDKPSPDLWILRMGAALFLVTRILHVVSASVFVSELMLQKAVFVSFQVLISSVVLPIIIISRNSNMSHFAKHTLKDIINIL